jgi:hypothetical protein
MLLSKCLDDCIRSKETLHKLSLHYIDSIEIIIRSRSGTSGDISKSYMTNSCDRANCLYEEYAILRDNYIGFPANCNSSFDAEKVGNTLSSLSRVKAAAWS